jgi:hypothetical protein
MQQWEIAGGIAGTGTALIAQAAVFWRWIYRRIRDDQVNRIFVRDVATNHLPHIFDAQRKIAEKLGIELGDPPMIRWMDFREEDTRCVQ